MNTTVVAMSDQSTLGAIYLLIIIAALVAFVIVFAKLTRPIIQRQQQKRDQAYMQLRRNQYRQYQNMLRDMDDE